MTQPLTINDIHNAIWEHTFDIASVAVAGKGSVRMTVWLTTNGAGGFTPTYKVVVRLDGKPREDINFEPQELDQAVTLYNSTVQRL